MSIQGKGQKLIGQYAAGDDVGITVALLGPSRNVVTYQFVGRKTERDIYQRLAEELAASTQFMNEQDSPVLRAWDRRPFTSAATADLSGPFDCSRCQVGRQMEKTAGPTTKPAPGGLKCRQQGGTRPDEINRREEPARSALPRWSVPAQWTGRFSKRQ